MSFSQKVRTCLWFAQGGEKAAEFYVSLLPDSFVETEYKPGESVFVVEFMLAGAPYMILNGGPHYEPSPAASISVLTKDQAETDELWQKLTADGGKESMCGWLIDRFGISWQIVPERLVELINDADEAAAGRAREAMLQMNKIDIAAMEAAFNGK
jgi:predicted 3-demethylubiquinone-9 3-methyltransferase (glyoxalase superfamily)